MTTLLICNIGTRDLQLDSLDGLPTELVANPKTGQLKARPAGEYLLQKEHFAQFKDRLRMPMIEKALRFITPAPDADLRIVLFATDQDEHVAPFYRDGDTIHFAHLIKDLLFLRHQKTGLVKKQIEIHTTNHNPADYDLMIDFYRQKLPKIADVNPKPQPIYLLIAGGTPQMNTMLLFIGSETFGAATQPLYVSQDFDRAHTLDVARQIYLQAVQRNLKVMLDAYVYSSALQVLDQTADYLDTEPAQLLRAALNYGIARRNLDLATAACAFDQSIKLTRGLRGTIQSLQREVEDQSEQAKLRETIFLAQLARRTHNWADFLARLHRFSEGCMQLLAEDLQVQWSKSTRETYAQAWWDAQRALLAGVGMAQATPPEKSAAENFARRVDRENLRKVLGALATAPEHAHIRQFLVELEPVDRPIPLRNNIVHRFTPISQEEIERKAEATVDDLLAAMRRAYQAAFGVVVPEESPYATLNRLCLDMLKGQR
ncbi:MAG: hypothetical protein EI684_21760 [Candidatus Viridilinea halotolerans]|uniref:TIGR02710 family CRISPR-associated protein n=1 Tax=Candidatus Viridilinea halotolerans TaxID=2491704 RepID=A0A426TR78_9CHLR|nr:MAG: hypothetical protein EI684_21760 [Candidatus Viridilinea halotolerans]